MKIHPQFRLNGKELSRDDLVEVAYSFIKEGQDFEVPIGDFLLDWLAPHPEIEVKTSGSTGTPKTIKLKKQQMVNSALATGKFFGLNKNDTALLCLPANYIAGKMMLVRAMVLGLQLDLGEPSSHPLQTMEKEYDFCAMVPLQVKNSWQSLARIKILIVGGAPVSAALAESLAALPTNIYETYGMTETITHIALKKLSVISRDNGKSKNFQTLPGVTVNLDDRECLVIDAPQVATEKVVTNDLVEFISPTEFRWLGRYDNIINSGGVKLIPEEIERKLATIINNRFFVTGIPDATLGQKLVLLIEGETSNEVLEGINKVGLEKYELPKTTIFVTKFTETPTGKIDRDSTVNALKTS